MSNFRESFIIKGLTEDQAVNIASLDSEWSHLFYDDSDGHSNFLGFCVAGDFMRHVLVSIIQRYKLVYCSVKDCYSPVK